MDLGFQGKTALVTGAGSQVGFGKEIALLLADGGHRRRGRHRHRPGRHGEDRRGRQELGCKSIAAPGRHHRQRGRQGHGRQGRRRVRPHRHPLQRRRRHPAQGRRPHRPAGPRRLGEAVQAQPRRHHERHPGGRAPHAGPEVRGHRQHRLGQHAPVRDGRGHLRHVASTPWTSSPSSSPTSRARTASASTAWPPVRRPPTSAPSCARESPSCRPKRRRRRAAFLGRFPLGRIGTARDIANATLFLASDVTSYVTGQVFHVSGGSVM